DFSAAADAFVHTRPAAAGVEQSCFACDAGALPARLKAVPSVSENDGGAQSPLSGRDGAPCLQARESIHAASLRGRVSLYAHGAAWNLDRPGDRALAATGSHSSQLP